MCTAILLTAAVSKQVVIRKLGIVMTKEPIALQKPLDEFDEAALSPYIVRNKAAIGREILESLGTEEYLQWIVEDPDVETEHLKVSAGLFHPAVAVARMDENDRLGL